MTTQNTFKWSKERITAGIHAKLRNGSKAHITAGDPNGQYLYGTLDGWVSPHVESWRSSDGAHTGNRNGHHPLDIVGEWEEPAPASPWRPYPETKPTAADADDKGRVIYGWPNGHCTSAPWDTGFAVDEAPDAWMPVPPREVPAPTPKPPVATVLPTLPEGFHWHKPDEVTPEMIADGYRPLVVGEMAKSGDELKQSHGWIARTIGDLPCKTSWFPYRTKRPIPIMSSRTVPLGPNDIPTGSLLRAYGEDVLWFVKSTSSAGIVRHDGQTIPYESAAENREYLRPHCVFETGWLPCRKVITTFTYPETTTPAPAASPLPDLFDIEEARRLLERHHDRIKALDVLTEKLDKALLQFPPRQEIIDIINKRINFHLQTLQKLSKQDTIDYLHRVTGVPQETLALLSPTEGEEACNSTERTASE